MPVVILICGVGGALSNCASRRNSMRNYPPPNPQPPTPTRMLPVTRVLVVEDDPDIAQLVVHYLGKAGFTAETVSSGREALALITARPPDLLVLDLMLPQVDGLEICRLARSNEATA